MTFPTLEKVYQSYNGARGCMCGCNGNWSHASEHVVYASKNRGYEVSEDEVSDAKVKHAYNKVKKAVEAGEGKYSEEYGNAYVDTKTRTTVVYFME